jgi:hypothetical protein
MPQASDVQWAALRQLREGENPTFERLAAAGNLHHETVRERASREGWKERDFRSKRPRTGAVLPPGIVLLPGGQVAGLAEEGTGQDVPLEELRRRFADIVPRQLARIITLAERGVIDKASIDGLQSMARALEQTEALAGERAAEQQKRSDDELAGMLEKIDERIVELAEVHAERLVAQRNWEGGG